MKQKSKVTPQVMQLNTHGTFRVLSAKSTTLRCGPHGVPRTIQYDIEIQSRPELLDERGFIVDWRDVALAVQNKYRNVTEFPSCERFALEIVDLTHDLLNGRCSGIKVKIGINGLPASMFAEYKEGQKDA